MELPDDDILEIDSPMEPAIDLPSEGEEMHQESDFISQGEHGDAPSNHASLPLKTLPSIPNHLRPPTETSRHEVLDYQEGLPYSVETLEEMDERLEVIARHLVDCAAAKDYDVGFVGWNHRLEMWLSLSYPMKRIMRARLAKLYWELAVLPGVEARLTEMFANMCMTLVESRKRIDIRDLQLDWLPMYKILEKELFPKQRKSGHTNVYATLLTLTEYAARFFSPHAAPQMLSTFLPKFDGSSLNSILSTQAFLCHFLPTSHPQKWRPMIFRLWEGFSSGHWEDQWLDLLSRLAVKHVDPAVSDPRVEEWLFRISEGEDSAQVAAELVSSDAVSDWAGIRQTVGIFTSHEWAQLMTKCLRAMSVPVGSSKSSSSTGGSSSGGAFLAHGTETGAAHADSTVSSVIASMKKPSERLHSLSVIIVYSMAEDGPRMKAKPGESEMPTPILSGVDLPRLAISPTDPGFKRPRAYLGGSRALDSLSQLLQATESFFHPSNNGPWQAKLCRFLQNLTWEFVRRWREEEKKDCTTPADWRLTEFLRREFVATVRPVCLLGMFGKDHLAVAAVQQAMKSLAYLEPGLMLPPVLERAFPALEGLLETHRTTACISALSTLAVSMVSRTAWPQGAKHLVPALELLLPGIDLNDGVKTMTTSMFIILAVSTIKIGDLTSVHTSRKLTDDHMEMSDSVTLEPNVLVNGERAGSPDSDLSVSREEEDELVRRTTSALPDWSVKFMRQVFNLFENLPEPGKNNRAGGKLEEQLISMLVTAVDYLCTAMSEPVFDEALNRYIDYVSNNARTNTVKSVGALAGCFVRANPSKTFRAVFPLCARAIRLELEGGASKVRTTSTTSPEGGDLLLHWYCAVMIGASTHAGLVLLDYKTEIMELLELMIQECYHERGSTYAARFLSTILNALVGVYTDDTRFTNADEWNSEDMQTSHHLHWGKFYNVKGVKIQWHVPSEKEIDFAMEILETLTTASLDKLDSLIHLESQGSIGSDADKVWKNEFVRHCYVIKHSFIGVASLIEISRSETPGKPFTDVGDTANGFLDDIPVALAGICLTTKDPRHARVLSIKHRSAKSMHEAIQRLKERRADDSIDSVKIIVSTIRTLMLDCPLERGTYEAYKRSFEFVRDFHRISKAQRLFPRVVWIKRAALHHFLRLRHNSLYRKRSDLDDLLIYDLCEMSLSQYTSVRKVAQRAVDLVAQAYDGTRTMLLDQLFASLKPGSDPDRMKGALHVLGLKLFCGMFIQNWRHGPRYIRALLQCQHEDKQSVQNLVQSLVQETVVRIFEVSTIKSTLSTPSLEAAIDAANEEISIPKDPQLVHHLAMKCSARKVQKDSAYRDLVPHLLSVAESPNSHWRYSLYATRFLRQLLRRDQPMDPAMAKFFADQMNSELPQKRTMACSAMIKILHFVKLRTMCEGSDEKLLLQQTTNPLRVKKQLPQPLPDDFTTNFIQSFTTSMRDTTSEVLLMDKQNTGWLVWGKEVDFYRVPPTTGEVVAWDPASKTALEILESVFVSDQFWVTLGNHLAQEHSRDYLAADNVTAIKSIFQIFRIKPWAGAVKVIESYLADPDRHKQRAAAELLGGVIRGTKHWPLDQQDVVWSWLQPRVQKIFNSITPDTQPAWEMFVDYVLGSRDPRRNQALVDFITNLELDRDASEAFGPAKAQYLVGSAVRALSWHFDPWADKFLDVYWSAIDHPYAEVRNAISDNLRSLTELRLHPSFPSTDAFLEDCLDPVGRSTRLMTVDPATERRIDSLVTILQEARKYRLPAQHGSQTYDKSAMTILTWLWSSLNDFRITTVYPFTTKLLPELFKMQELVDNQELRKTARAVIQAISALAYPLELVKPTLQTLLTLLKTSESWRVRLDVLPVLQVFFFHQLYVIDDIQVLELLECLCNLLRDSNPEVREAAATSLSGIVRCSQRRAILKLKERFLKVIRDTKLPARRLDQHGRERLGYQDQLIVAHSGVLGATALINAFPYEVPCWMPDLLLETLGTHTSSPAPISTTVKQTLSDFKKSHQDSWTEDQKAFTDEQLMSLNDLLIGSSYYA